MMIQPILAVAEAAKAGNEAAQHTGFSGALQYLAGFVFVILTLALLWLITSLMGQFFIAQDKKKKAAKEAEEAEKKKVAAAAAVAAMTTPVAAGVTPQLIAVLTAAAQSALDEDIQIVSIRSGSAGHDWSTEGRRAIFDSKKVR